MPIYRYKCRECQKEFTALTSMGKENQTRCKECGSSRVEKLLPRSFVGKTCEGTVTGSGCSTCSSSSCSTCRG